MQNAPRAQMPNQNGRTRHTTYEPYEARIAHPSRGEDRDREQRGSMRGEDPGYQDLRDQRGRDTWRTYDRDDRRIDQRLDYGGEDRLGDRGWSNAPEQLSERDRGMFAYRGSGGSGDRYRQRDDIYGIYGRPSDFERDRGYGEPGYGGYGDREYGGYRNYSGNRDYSGYRDQEYAARDRSDRDLGRPSDVGRPFQVDRDERMGGARGYAGQGGQIGPQVGGPIPQARGPHRGRGPAGFQRSDERIKELVCEALTDHDEVDATDIEVSVRNGEVTLAGTVDDRRMKRLAEECVENVRGVKDVQNQLRVAADRVTGSKTGSSAADKTDKTDQTDKKPRPS
jgi:hypothetical protein